MSNVIPFVFENQAVRIVNRDGEPWFVLADVCRVLEIANPSNVAARLDDDEKATLQNMEGQAGNGAQAFTIINESGLYSLVLTSRKPAAKRFKKWVTAEVLPSIRRTGRYAVAGLASGMRKDDGLPMAQAAGQHLTTRELNAWWRHLEGLNMLFGRRIAAAHYPRTPLPAIDPETLPVPQITPPALDGIACLMHLLAVKVRRSPLRLADMLKLAKHGGVTRQQLGATGILVDPENLRGWVAIACAGPRLQAAFRSTAWFEGWETALLCIPGCRLAPELVGFPDRHRRAVLVPWEVMAQMMEDALAA